MPALKTVLITGCSSGYGLEIARHFHVYRAANDSSAQLRFPAGADAVALAMA
ncbi:MAG TPA: hypothetical protein VFY61_01875 [Pyrinomonadaceae bacterium]|nr:hypothetical protein [Pyrinomonadaceae bacterium]